MGEFNSFSDYLETGSILNESSGGISFGSIKIKPTKPKEDVYDSYLKTTFQVNYADIETSINFKGEKIKLLYKTGIPFHDVPSHEATIDNSGTHYEIVDIANLMPYDFKRNTGYIDGILDSVKDFGNYKTIKTRDDVKKLHTALEQVLVNVNKAIVKKFGNPKVEGW